MRRRLSASGHQSKSKWHLRFLHRQRLRNISRPWPRPWGHDAVHASVGDRLPHMLVGVNDDTKVHSIDRNNFAIDADLALKVIRLQMGASRSYRIQGTPQPVDDVGLGSYCLFHSDRHVRFPGGRSRSLDRSWRWRYACRLLQSTGPRVPDARRIFRRGSPRRAPTTAGRRGSIRRHNLPKAFVLSV